MNNRLTPATAGLLVIPPLLWAGNAVVGRMVSELVPPITLNFLRWTMALLILLPLGSSIFRKGSTLWAERKHFAMIGLLGIGLYNALQYMALHTSTPINVTLVGASMPIWMLIVGRLFFDAPIAGRQLGGAFLSMSGVLTVLGRGQWSQVLELRFVAGDILMIVATIVWAFYSWLLAQPRGSDEIRRNWATFMLAQVVYGAAWSGVFAAGEWAVTDAVIHWGWPLALTVLYVSVGPGILAFRCWGLGVQRAGPATAAFFSNLTPLFAALLSSAFLKDAPQVYHAVAFVLIVSGIVLSSRR